MRKEKIFLIFLLCFSTLLDCISSEDGQLKTKAKAKKYCKILKCKDIYRETSADYDQFHKISSEQTDSESSIAKKVVHFYVIGGRETNIYLSSTNDLRHFTKYGFEIVLGGCTKERQTCYVIRERRDTYLSVVHVAGPFSPDEPVEVFINIYSDGKLEVVVEKEAVISAQTNLILNNINYYAFGSWNNTNHFFYECDETTYLSQVDPDISDYEGFCGVKHRIHSFIYGGQETRQGDWPWIVAIHIKRNNGLVFTCSGTLISSRSVITAAHCIRTISREYQPHEILISLGRYSLADWNEVGAVSSNVERVIIHPDYKRQSLESFDADIAIIALQKHVSFTQYIRPICLWPTESNINDIVGQNGTIVGWGQDGSSYLVSNIPKKIDLPIVTPFTCIQTTDALAKSVSYRTFCAGTLAGDGPCHGDSGGGLMIYRNNGWTLRGIVSSGITDAATGHCKLQEYVVFTDVASFLPWIKHNL